jgi:hypothetical protein
MARKGLFTKILAITGTVIVWLPILAPIIISAPEILRDHIFRFDYLMPAELFQLVLVGGGLLLWAALRARSQVKLVGWCLAAAAGSLVLSQAMAVVTGLASGTTEPNGLPLVLVAVFLAAYVIAVIGIGIGGIRLMRDLFSSSDYQR